MFEKLRYEIGDGDLTIKGYLFSLGMFSTEVLNITPEQYKKLRTMCDEADAGLSEYEKEQTEELWNIVISLYGALSDEMGNIRILKLLDEFTTVPDEAKTDTQYRTLTIRFLRRYSSVLSDISSFNTTVRNFIDGYLSDLKKLDSENFAAAFADFILNPKREKLIANPISGAGWYTTSDTVTVSFCPGAAEDDSGRYAIYEVYEAENLQTLLKMDFYRMLKKGYIIRRCEYCKRYFHLKKAYHTKYCDRPAPDRPDVTCLQMGYHRLGIKEMSSDNPHAQALRRCYLRIDKDRSRGIITAEEKGRLYDAAVERFYEATRERQDSLAWLEEELTSAKLYASCGVKRKTVPRGRPKKEKDIK